MAVDWNSPLALRDMVLCFFSNPEEYEFPFTESFFFLSTQSAHYLPLRHSCLWDRRQQFSVIRIAIYSTKSVVQVLGWRTETRLLLVPW